MWLYILVMRVVKSGLRSMQERRACVRGGVGWCFCEAHAALDSCVLVVVA